MAEQETQDNSYLPTPLQRQVLLGKVAPDWEVTQPLWVTVERDEDGSYLVSDEIFLQYGTGDSEREALHDYISSLIEYYHLLEERLDLNPHNQPLFRHLQAYRH